MEILYLLLPLSILFVLLIAGAFWWAIFSGQFDDSEKAARSILLDDDSADSAASGPESAGTAPGRHEAKGSHLTGSSAPPDHFGGTSKTPGRRQASPD